MVGRSTGKCKGVEGKHLGEAYTIAFHSRHGQRLAKDMAAGLHQGMVGLCFQTQRSLP